MPTRMLRETILTSEKVNRLSLGAEVFYRRLMSVVDDFGRFHASRIVLLGSLFPLRADSGEITVQMVSEWLDECHLVGLVRLYAHNGQDYLEITNFNQRVRAAKSRFPDPDDTTPGADPENESSGDLGLFSRNGSGPGQTNDRQVSGSCRTNDRSRAIDVDVDVDVDVDEKENSPEGEEKKSLPDLIDRTMADLIERWNDLPDPFPRAKATSKRKKALKERLRDQTWRDGWKDAIERIPDLSFLGGANDRGWIANLEWFLRPDTVTKILEGSYQNARKDRKAYSGNF